MSHHRVLPHYLDRLIPESTSTDASQTAPMRNHDSMSRRKRLLIIVVFGAIAFSLLLAVVHRLGF